MALSGGGADPDDAAAKHLSSNRCPVPLLPVPASAFNAFLANLRLRTRPAAREFGQQMAPRCARAEMFAAAAGLRTRRRRLGIHREKNAPATGRLVAHQLVRRLIRGLTCSPPTLRAARSIKSADGVPEEAVSSAKA